MNPVVVINFKTYPGALGKKGILLAERLAQVGKKKYNLKRYNLLLAPTLLTAAAVARAVSLPVIAQHCDGDAQHKTGMIDVAELKLVGIRGVLLNHSEHKVSFLKLRSILAACRPAGLFTMICADSLSEAKKVAGLHPDYLAYEPRELIGGNVSVTDAHPDLIQKAVRSISSLSRNTKVLCGAGVHSSADLQKALEYGAAGVLLSHAVVQAKDPGRVLERILTVR